MLQFPLRMQCLVFPRGIFVNVFSNSKVLLSGVLLEGLLRIGFHVEA